MVQTWDPGGEASAALARAVEGFGPQVLGRADMLSGLLEDDVPHLPREVALLTAAAKSGTSARLTERVQHGLPPGQAVVMTASEMAARTAMDASGAEWAVGEFARVLGHPAQPAPTPAAGQPKGKALQWAHADVASAAPVAQAMPVIGPDEEWSAAPFALVDGDRYTIGWQFFAPHEGGPRFLILRRNAFGTRTIVARYPLTDQGWSSAWQSLLTMEPGTAERAREALAGRTRTRRDRLGPNPDAAQAAADAGPPPTRTRHEPLSSANEVAKLAALLNDGIITRAEFEQLKAQLIKEMRLPPAAGGRRAAARTSQADSAGSAGVIVRVKSGVSLMAGGRLAPPDWTHATRPARWSGRQRPDAQDAHPARSLGGREPARPSFSDTGTDLAERPTQPCTRTTPTTALSRR